MKRREEEEKKMRLREELRRKEGIFNSLINIRLWLSTGVPDRV